MAGVCVAGGHAWQGVCMAGGMCGGRWGVHGGGVHGRGACMSGGMCGGGQMCGRGHAWQLGGGMCDRDVHGGGHVWQGVCACMAGGHVWQGACVAGCAWQGHVWQGVCMHPPTNPHYEIRSVNARAVRILLECILVFDGTDFWTNWGNVIH